MPRTLAGIVRQVVFLGKFADTATVFVFKTENEAKLIFSDSVGNDYRAVAIAERNYFCSQFNELESRVCGYVARSGDCHAFIFYVDATCSKHLLKEINITKSGSLGRERLFAPLGISDFHWEVCPKGIEKGGWGLYIKPEDLAKLGQLVLDGGMWQGQRLLSKEYIDAATSVHAQTPEGIGDFDYGYQIWVGRHENAFLFNGMLGQNVLGFRDSGTLVVSHAGANTDFQESRFFEIVSRYFGGSFPEQLPENASDFAALEETVRGLSDYNRSSLPLDQAAEPFLNRCFSAQDDKAASVGLLPLALQALHNNYSTGFESVAVTAKGEVPELIYREKNALYRLPIGLGRPVVTQLDFRGNVFLAAASGRFTHDEEERSVFYIRLEFLETPCVRIIKLILDGDRMLLREAETPGVPYVSRKLCEAGQSALYRPLLLVAAGGTEEDFLMYKTLQVLSPEIICRDMGKSE